MRVAVLGGGHGAVAAAGDLALRGHDVRLALRNRERFAEIFATRRIRLRGLIDGEAEVAVVTDDHAVAVDGSEVVVVPLPADVTEDVACGLVLWASLGRRLGVPTPLADVFLTLASTVNGDDYAATGRTLENLGLAAFSVSELQEKLRDG